MVYGGALNFGYFKKLVMFLSFVYLSYYAVNISLCRTRLLNVIKTSPLIAGVVMVVSYFFLELSVTSEFGSFNRFLYIDAGDNLCVLRKKYGTFGFASA